MANQNQPKPLANLEISAFCGQLAMILRSGISALEGLSILLEDAQTPQEKQLLSLMYEEMSQTGTLYSALQKAGVFPPYLLQMAQIGEETGRLDEVMETLKKHYDREEAISSGIRSALTYPMVMIVIMVLVIIILLTKVMPVFQQVFRQLGREMTGLAGGILAVGNALSRYAVVLVIIVAFLVFLCFFFTHSQKGRRALSRLGRHFRFSRRIAHSMAACRFAGGMALALKSGLTPEQGLEYAENLVDQPDFCQKIAACKKQLGEGVDLSKALTENGIFTGAYARTAAIAGRTGTMDEAMEEIAGQYEEETDSAIASFISVLEPTLVIILSIIVGIILLAVMVPLMGIMAGL